MEGEKRKREGEEQQACSVAFVYYLLIYVYHIHTQHYKSIFQLPLLAPSFSPPFSCNMAAFHVATAECALNSRWCTTQFANVGDKYCGKLLAVYRILQHTYEKQ